MLRPDMIIDGHTLRLIQTTNRYLHAVGQHFLVHAEGAAAR